jgi:hypothetical protein
MIAAPVAGGAPRDPDVVGGPHRRVPRDPSFPRATMTSSALIFRLASIVACLALSAGMVPVHAADTPAMPGAPTAEGAKGPKASPRPIRKDRVFLKDIEGLWIARDYVEALRAVRMPLAAARKAKPLAINIRKDRNKFTVLRTDFGRAILLDIVDIEPGPKPGEFRLVAAPDASGPVNSADVTYLPARAKAGEGRFDSMDFSDPSFSKKRSRNMVRLDEGLGALVNGIVIAGSYVDAKGQSYAFTPKGEATMPDGAFSYELALAPVAGQCELIESVAESESAPRKRVGFDWKGGRLHLFEVTGDGKSGLRCAKEPFAVLTPAGAAAGDRS